MHTAAYGSHRNKALALLPVGIEALPARENRKCIRNCIRPSVRIARRIGGFPVPRRIGGFRKKEAIMARDGNGRDHKAAGRPDGGQYEEKAGQGLDDDLEVPTTAESVAPDEGWWTSLEDDPEAAGLWWERKDRMTPELETMRRTVMEAHSRKEAADILDGLSELARCAVIRNLPFARKAAVADLAPDPDGQSDPATMAAGLPYTADDAKAGLLIGRAAKGDVRAVAALAFHGSDGDREWLAKSPMAEHPSVRAALKAVSGDDDEPEKDGDRVKKTES